MDINCGIPFVKLVGGYTTIEILTLFDGLETTFPLVTPIIKKL
jgi:hypothetical protein